MSTVHPCAPRNTERSECFKAPSNDESLDCGRNRGTGDLDLGGVCRQLVGDAAYDNVSAQAYPPILALAGLTDPRVTYWEPAKWVARLRATMTSGGPILLKTQMGAGHGGASGRFDRLREIAEQYAFALACCSDNPR